jgi:hypothetical protein
VAPNGKKRNAYRKWVKKTERKNLLERTSQRWEFNSKMDLKDRM